MTQIVLLEKDKKELALDVKKAQPIFKKMGY